MRKYLSVLLSAALAASAVFVYAGTCPTAKPAVVHPRTTSDCLPGPLWMVHCEDETFTNGGCLAPNDKDFKCEAAPMTNPVSYYTYHPVDGPSNCYCEADSPAHTPTGQQKGIQLSTPCTAPTPDPVEVTPCCG
jgi:hypothetical protein